MVAHEAVILNDAKTPVFAIEDETDVAEEVRLRYRYLDLRRPPLQRNLRLRHRFYQVIAAVPGRARASSRSRRPSSPRARPRAPATTWCPAACNPGEFFALPQSPQLFKQILMVAGFDRYFQIVKCFRDEDLRADRQPEFTQIDIEMSFVDRDDVLATMEGLMVEIFREVRGIELPLALPAHHLRRGDAAVRSGRAGPALRAGAPGRRRPVRGERVPRFRAAACRRRRVPWP